MALLNTADALYLGDTPVRRVYLGDTLVWQPPLERLIALAGTRGAVWIVGVSPAWQDEARTVPAGDGDPVRVIDDLSGNGYHWVAPNDAARPALVQAGAHWHLLFDGVDDRMVCDAFGTPSWPHDGSGATLAMMVDEFWVESNNRNIFVTAQTNSWPGLSIASAGTSNLRADVNNGRGDNSERSVSENISAVDGARYLYMEHAAHLSPQWQVYAQMESGPAYSAGDYSYPVSSGIPQIVPRLFASTNNQPARGRWHGGCLLPVTGHGDLVDLVLRAHAPPIPDDEELTP